jgi:endogenous inhibitor of DNA gyrase (YacG/DUF329 family)
MSEPQPTPAFKPRHVRCPACSGPSLYSNANAYRPFCSARCKGVDLGAWASEEFKLPDETPPDEPFGDPRLQ